MKNRIILKKHLLLAVLISIIYLVLFTILNILEYHTYTSLSNNKINSILVKLKEEYPNVSENEIIEILNSDFKEDVFLYKYGINIKNDSIVLDNNLYFKKYLIINMVFITISLVSIIIIFLKMDNKKNKELKDITRYIEEINKKNYELHIDELNEDELSILKSEIYKTTIMLKESAENSLKDKKNLKMSLEDISHQLKTPLTSILIILDNLIEDEDMDKNIREEFIKDIKREILNINFLVQSILKLSKFDSNTIVFNNDKYFVNDILSECINRISPICDLKNINVNIKGDKNIELYCDYKWQIEALTNIIKNCIEYTECNKSIDIEYNDNKIYTCIIITDKGSGISKEDLPHIFERFYKGNNSSNDSIGIGLSLAKSIVEKNDGVISVDTSDVGTTFTIKYFKK